jgi:3'(2'), 5'-bisphosphate nucleotidase
MSDHDVAARLAAAAGELLLDVRTELADASESERKAAGDKRSHDFLMEALAAERPGDAVLSEEGADNPVRLTAERVWIVDPLDGTREFVTPPPATADKPRIVVSRTRPPAIALTVRDALHGTLVEMGSAGAKVASVVQGRSDIYVHAGGQYEWDSAAPVAVARAAGLHTSRIDGSPLVYNQPDPLLPDLVVCRPEFAAAVLAVTAP